MHNSATAILYLVFAVIAVAGSVWLISVWVPDRIAAERAYRSAPSCAQASRADDCVRDEEFTVSDIHIGKKQYKATLTDSAGTAWRVGFAGEDPLLNELHDGDRVTGTVWQGAVQEIAAKGTRQKTWERPVNPPGTELAMAIGLGAAGLVLGVVCGWRLRQGADRHEPTRRMRYLVRLAAGLGAAGIAATVLTAVFDLRLWMGPALWALFSAPMAAWAVRAWRRAPFLAPEPWTPKPL
ncbi:hypothetical protein CP973_37120 [Streptomyces albofaciens JCM 4342]|nr:hypothetical protein CP973_37120 [Streptomyces albofaciens JCM 4342]